MIFAVSNYYRYELVNADCETEAVALFTEREDLTRISNEDLECDSTVVLAMCVAYTDEVKRILESLEIDIDRVLLMNEFSKTSFYSTCWLKGV
ncbi:hypothetical protein AB6D33_20620 [Vibrio splendidus]